MTHPSLDEILAGGSAPHLARCEMCRRLATLAGLAVAPGPAAEPPGELPAVSRAHYTGWVAIDDARGGMGRVVRAHDVRLGRDVAIKLLRADLDPAHRAALAERFGHEARLTAKLQHPSIVGVHEAGRFDDGEPFYAMPLLRGVPLRAEIERRPALAERLALLPHVVAVADAIAYAHGEGIVHRDIKPDNILVGSFGETVVIDWGLAKQLDAPDGDAREPSPPPASGGWTQLGVGTAHYMPPEQARGDQLDVRADVYAVGATLYHVLAGVPPYGGAGATDVRRALAETPPAPLAELVPEVPRELADIVERAMARDRGVRFATARELADELRRFSTGQLLMSRRYTLGELARHFARRHRTALRSAAVAAVVLIAVVAVALVRIARARDRATASALRAERELRVSQGTVASELAKEPARRLEAVALGVDAVGPDLAAGRAPEPAALQGLLDALTAGPALVPLDHDGQVEMLAAGAGRLVGADNHALDVWDPATGARLAAWPSSLTGADVAVVSPDGAHAVICGFDPAADLFELATGVRHRLDARANVAGCGFLPDGRLVTAADEVVIRDPRTLAVAQRFALPAAATGLAIARSGRVAVAALDGTLWLWQPGAAPVAAATGVPLGAIARFSPDGRTLYDSGRDEVARAFAVDDPTHPRVVAADRDGHLGLIMPGPDGAAVGIGMYDVDGRRSGELVDPAGVRPPRPLPGMVTGWAPDGRWVVVEENGPIELVDPITRRGVLALRAHHDETIPMWVGRDRLASASRDGAVLLWDVASGAGAGQLLGHTGEIVRIAVRGGRVLTASRDGTARIWRADGSALVIAGGHELVDAAWLDDGAVVVADLGGEVRVVDAATGAVRASRRLGGPIGALAVAPGAARIAIGDVAGALEIVDGALAHPVALASPHAAVTALAFSPDGGRLASGHADGSTRLWEAATGRALAIAPDRAPLADGSGPVTHDGPAALRLTGAHVLVARTDGTTLVLDPATLAPRGELAGRMIGAAAPGDRIALARSDGRLAVTSVAAAPAAVQPLPAVPGRAAAVDAAFTGDGGRLVSAAADGSVRAWDLAAGTAVAQFAANDLGAATALAIDRDRAIVGYASGAVRLYPLTPAAALAQGCAVLAAFGRSSRFCARSASART